MTNPYVFTIILGRLKKKVPLISISQSAKSMKFESEDITTIPTSNSARLLLILLRAR